MSTFISTFFYASSVVQEALFSPLFSIMVIDSRVLILACFVVAFAVGILLMTSPGVRCPRCAAQGIEQ